MSYRPRGKGTYQIRVMVDGVRHERTVKARNDAEAAIREAELKFELGQPPAATAATMTVAELAEHYWAIEGSTKEVRTAEGYRGNLDRYVIPDLGAYQVADVSVVMLRRWFADIANGTRARGGDKVAASTLRQIKAPLSRMFSLAVEMDLVPFNFVKSMPLPKVAPADPVERVPDRAALDQLIANAHQENAELGRALFVAARTGTRRGELCALRWSDLDLEGDPGRKREPSVRIARAIIKPKGQPQVEKDYPKGRRARRVTIGPETVAVLKSQRAAMAARALACGVTLDANAFLFSDAADGSEAWSLNTLSSRWKRHAYKAGLGDHRLHDLRHFFVTSLLDEGLDVHIAQRAAGHSTIAVTDRYIQGRDADPRVGAALEGVLSVPGNHP